MRDAEMQFREVSLIVTPAGLNRRMSSRVAVIAAVAERQWGVVSRTQLTDAGYSPNLVYGSVRAGHLRLVQPGVYVVAGSPASWHQAVMAAVLSGGAGCVASHLTAAHIWGLVDRRPEAIEVSVGRSWPLKRSYIVHQSSDLEPADVGRRHRIPVTLPVRTFLDLGCVAGRTRTEDVLDESLRRRLFTMQEAADLLVRVGRRGRNGAGVAREIMTTRLGLDTVGDSWLESRFLRIVRSAGLPDPQPQFEVAHCGRFVCRVDFAWPDADPLVTVELDSERHHLDRATFRSDRRKDRALRRVGITALRYTAWDLRFDAEGIARELAVFLAVPRPQPEIAVAHHATADPELRFRQGGGRQMRGFST
jgi:hypothetical protein